MIYLSCGTGAACHRDRATVLIAVKDDAANLAPCRAVSLVGHRVRSELSVYARAPALALPVALRFRARLFRVRKVGRRAEVGGLCFLFVVRVENVGLVQGQRIPGPTVRLSLGSH